MDLHAFLLNPPGSLPFWTPWKCICGAGGTGYDQDAARRQYDLHRLGAWPSYTEPVGDSHPFVTPWGETVWVTESRGPGG